MGSLAEGAACLPGGVHQMPSLGRFVAKRTCLASDETNAHDKIELSLITPAPAATCPRIPEFVHDWR